MHFAIVVSDDDAIFSSPSLPYFAYSGGCHSKLRYITHNLKGICQLASNARESQIVELPIGSRRAGEADLVAGPGELSPWQAFR